MQRYFIVKPLSGKMDEHPAYGENQNKTCCIGKPVEKSPFSGRNMDINDILLNIAGGLIGVILVWLLRPGESGQHES